MLNNFRLPYREDSSFSFLVLLIFIVPLAFTIYTYENFETVKFSLFLFLFGCSLLSFVIKVFRQKFFDIKYHKTFYIWLGVFILWTALSTIFAYDKLYAVVGFYYRFTNGF